MSADDFFSGGNKSAKFDQMNVPVGGAILSVGPERQQRDLDGDLLWWDKAETEPKMQLPIDVQTDLRDPADATDDGVRTIYVKKGSQMLRAVGEAVKAAGQRGAPKVGGTLHVAWINSEKASNPKYNDKKIYAAKYEAPGVGDAFFGKAEQPAPVAAQPQPEPAAAAAGNGRPW